MQTNIVSSIFLLIFLKNVASHHKLHHKHVVDLINKGLDLKRQIKLNEGLELIRDLVKFDDKGVKIANNNAFDYDEPELDYDEQDTFKVENCWSLIPKDIRECLEYNIIKIKGQSVKNEMGAERDVFENFKTPEECLTLEATVFVQMECLAKFKIPPMDSKGIKHFESDKDDFVNVKSPEDCWKIKNIGMSRKLNCLKTFYKKNDETDVYESMNLKDPNDCLSLKTTITNKNKCLDQFGKGNDDNYKGSLGDDFENLQEPNDCLFLKETIEVKLKCLDKFQKVEEKATQKEKEMKIATVDKITLREYNKMINSPDDCFFAHTTYEKLKCLEHFENHKENFRSRSIEPTHQFIARRPKRKIYSFYNYYNGLMKPAAFKDFTRQEFSQDYLDISELSRSIPKCRPPGCNIDLLKLSYQLKEKKADLKNNSRRFFDSVHTRFIQDDSNEYSDEIVTRRPKKRKVQKKKNGVPIRFTVVSKEERPPDSDSDEHRNLKAGASWESFEDKEDSEEEHQNLKKKKKVPKEKIDSSEEGKYKKSFLWFESEESKEISSESESTKKSFVKNNNKKKKAKKYHVDDDYSIETERPSSFKYSYLQGNNIVDFFRRRLEHFLPKRFHWEEKDFKDLGYHWYDGPRGRWTK